MAVPEDLANQSEMLRSLHVPGDPLVLPNAWDVASARAVVAAGFPVVATTSGGVAATLGYEDEEAAPAEEMLAAAARIARSVDVPVTVDAEAGYGMEAGELVASLRSAGAAGCNLEDTDHSTGELREREEQASRLRRIREADDYGLVVNARVDVFLHGNGSQAELVEQALDRARTYFDAGADCVYPILLSEAEAIAAFLRDAGGPVNILADGSAPTPRELAALGVARVSYGTRLHRDVMQRFEESLALIRR
jgi:2-methylisocitrate lyase-like PEP mutase family enzyme